MNKKIILWTAAVIITLLVLFLHRRMGPYYPVSGTLQIENEKVTFVLPKIHYGKEPVEIFLRNDLPNLSGRLFWKKDNERTWNSTLLANNGKYLYGKIPADKAGQSIIYRGELYYKQHTYVFPRSDQTMILFEGKRPDSVLNVLYAFLYGGILLAVRSATEYFNENDKKRLFSFLTATFFFIASIVFFPLIKSYELDVINKSVPPITELFDPALVMIFIVWLICSVLVFWKSNKLILLLSGILTVIIYQFSNFY